MRERRVRKRGSEWRGANSSALLKCSASLSLASTARSINSRASPHPPRRAPTRARAARRARGRVLVTRLAGGGGPLYRVEGAPELPGAGPDAGEGGEGRGV